MNAETPDQKPDPDPDTAGWTFGHALDALRDGRRVTRLAWTGPRTPWLVLVPGSEITVTAGRPLGDAAPDLIHDQVRYHPHIDIFTPERTVQTWSPAHADLLADDWTTVS